MLARPLSVWVRRAVVVALLLTSSAVGTAWYIDGTRSVPTRVPTTAAGTSAKSPAASVATTSPPQLQPSQCIGRVNGGSLKNGWKLPAEGPNYQTYSGLGSALGRTYVHSAVYDVVLETYAELRVTHPDLHFVYGETGLERGGRFAPHRTHQTGTSVDFVVPVRDERGEVAVLPTSAANKWGYDIEFDASGAWNGYVIDLEAVAAHLASLARVSRAQGIPITKVVLFPPLRRRLAETDGWKEIASLPFTKREAWVRHDDHYHVDFGVVCRDQAATAAPR